MDWESDLKTGTRWRDTALLKLQKSSPGKTIRGVVGDGWKRPRKVRRQNPPSPNFVPGGERHR